EHGSDRLFIAANTASGCVLLRTANHPVDDVIQEPTFGNPPYEPALPPLNAVAHDVATAGSEGVWVLTDGGVQYADVKAGTWRSVTDAKPAAARRFLHKEAGCAWYADAEGQVWQLAEGTAKKAALRLSGVLQTVGGARKPDAVPVVDAEGCVTLLDLQNGTVRQAGRSPLPRVQVLCVVPDGRIFGLCGDGIGAFFRMDPRPGLPMLSEKLSRGFWVDAQVFPIKDEEDRVRFVVVFLQDKTVQKELEQVLSAAHKMEMIGTLAGGVAHDVNDILAGIMGYASLLAGPVVPDDERRDVVARLLEVTRRGAELTRHMLTVARKSIPDRQMVDLVALVDALAQQQGPLFSPLHRIECRHQGPLPVTAIDRLQIERVILNLVQNAADAMPEGGTITLATTCETVDAWSSGRLPDMPSGNYVMVSVSDHGIGMSIENQGRIFEPFFSTKGVDGRVGLGLAIAYGIVKSHQGFITLQSAPGLGSTFSVWLPVEAADDLNRVAGDGQEPANEMPAMTILVVDDDPMVREVLGRMVRAMGHEGILVDGAEAALVALEQDGPKIDLVMSDVLMPGLSGLDLIEVLRRAWPTMPVLLCTGAEAPEMHQKLRHWRGVTLLPKPFAAETLRRSL
ncbi:MAG TPA: ATP-binding protein, partial [Candidatus Latescibacteria bacterium]|nr:ATP-binding protein [Candidatus Latescibacterota bacterium]